MPSVLHVGSIAGVPQELSKAQRRLGWKSDVMTFQPHQFKYEVDIYRPARMPFPLKYAEKMHSFSKVVGDYDVIHFHWSSIVPFGFDLPFWKRMGKRIIMHHHGDDVRRKGEGRLYERFADEILVSTPDLLKWSPHAKWLPNPIDLELYQYAGVRDNEGKIRIAHAPSDRTIKGTEHVIRAVESLKEDGCDVELDLIENIPHYEAIERYRHADIIVDQLLVGWYGMLAIEGMALGKPVCVYIKEELKSYLSGSPLVTTSPVSLEEDLRALIDDASLRRKIATEARSFAERIHDAGRIARWLSEEVYDVA
jgi:glycosyltransferase involved in cell wall biosynthesis